MLRYLRIAVTALGLTVCLLLCALWVRSCWWRDRIEGRLSDSMLFNVWSVQGQLCFLTLSKPGHWRFTTMPVHGKVAIRTQFACGFQTNDISAVIYFPYWIAVLAFAALAAVPWLRWRRFNFTLRTLLVATTLVSLVIRIAVALR